MLDIKTLDILSKVFFYYLSTIYNIKIGIANCLNLRVEKITYI